MSFLKKSFCSRAQKIGQPSRLTALFIPGQAGPIGFADPREAFVKGGSEDFN
jgi:hypothetical protein